MKYAKVIFTLAFLFAVSGCTKNDDKKAEKKDPSTEGSKTQTQTKIEMPNVKYPAAVIFEGGQGDTWFDQDNTKHSPMWRLYICLGKTTQPVSGQVVLNLSQLGTPLEQTWQNYNTKEKLYTERLNQVILDYVYTTELSADPENNYGYAYGNAAIEIKSIQSWELVYLAPNQQYNHQEWTDKDFFNVKLHSGSLSHFSQTKFELNGETHYIYNSLARFTYSANDNKSSVIEVCEKADKAFVLQIGKDISPIQ